MPRGAGPALGTRCFIPPCGFAPDGMGAGRPYPPRKDQETKAQSRRQSWGADSQGVHKPSHSPETSAPHPLDLCLGGGPSRPRTPHRHPLRSTTPEGNGKTKGRGRQLFPPSPRSGDSGLGRSFYDCPPPPGGPFQSRRLQPSWGSRCPEFPGALGAPARPFQCSIPLPRSPLTPKAHA